MEDARAIRSDAKELVIIRDFLAHGHLYGYDSKTGVYRFNKLDNDKEHLMHVQDTLDTTLKGLIGATVKIQGLFDRNHRINLGLAG